MKDWNEFLGAVLAIVVVFVVCFVGNLAATFFLFFIGSWGFAFFTGATFGAMVPWPHGRNQIVWHKWVVLIIAPIALAASNVFLMWHESSIVIGRSSAYSLGWTIFYIVPQLLLYLAAVLHQFGVIRLTYRRGKSRPPVQREW